jgi:hypothetical protein
LGAIALSLALIAAGGSNPKEPAADAGAVIKVYALADLVSPIRVKPGALSPCSLADWSAGLQSDAEEQLGRIEKVLRLAMPKESWEEGNGRGAIAAYPEKLSLIIRQTDAGHRAIDDLLKELRKGDDFEIELQVEVAGIGRVQDDKVALQMIQKLGHPMTAEELADVRQHIPNEAKAIVRLGNGRTVVGGGVLQSLMPRFTAVAATDRTSIELRLDNITDDDKDGKYPWTTQSQTILVDKTVGMLITCDGGGMAYLITPRIVPRRQP